MLMYIAAGLFVTLFLIHEEKLTEPLDEQVCMVACVTLSWPAALYLYIKK